MALTESRRFRSRDAVAAAEVDFSGSGDEFRRSEREKPPHGPRRSCIGRGEIGDASLDMVTPPADVLDEVSALQKVRKDLKCICLPRTGRIVTIGLVMPMKPVKVRPPAISDGDVQIGRSIACVRDEDCRLTSTSGH
jgi:hypothetical protein